MKVTRYHIPLLFLIGLLLSCAKKKYPESVIENAAVYNFSATVGGLPVSLSAGIGGYYMYSSYAVDSNKVYNFIADLKQQDCSDCHNSLRIQINDYKTSLPGAPAKIDSSLRPVTYPLLTGVSSYSVNFQGQFNKAGSSYLWDFGDGTTSAVLNPSHVFEKGGKYAVKLKITSADGCESTSSSVEQFDESGTLKAYVSASANFKTLSFTPVTSGGHQPFSYLWSFGDGSGDTNPTAVHNYAITGAYPVTLRITDATGAVAVVNYNAVTQDDQSSCATNYIISSARQITKQAATKSLSKIIISWTDANGVVYTSNNELQPVSSHFEIVSVEDGGLNENNEPIKKLHLRFNCRVYNGVKSLVIDNAETTVCVAYK